MITGSAAELLGGIALLLTVFVWGRLRQSDRPGGTSSSTPAGAAAARLYTLLGARAVDGQPVHLPSSRPAGTRVTWTGPAGPEVFELTNAALPDGTFAAEPRARYR
ncbi:hypothetical protein [Streptomyces erythrochromogenes]|uniref:hypothetical protein n=1 Tax=Streptomyces erythrochromogenes TaxID=285574 RepID=UPI0036757A0D